MGLDVLKRTVGATYRIMVIVDWPQPFAKAQDSTAITMNGDMHVLCCVDHHRRLGVKGTYVRGKQECTGKMSLQLIKPVFVACKKYYETARFC